MSLEGLELTPETALPCNTDVAKELLAEIYGQLDSASHNEIVLERSWMRLGELLLKFKASEYWREVGFQTFEKFMLDLRDKYNRGKTQLWSYLTVAEKLLPIIDAATLEEIGISKALELKRGLKKANGKALPADIIEKAKQQTTTIKEVRALIGQAFNLAPDDKGSWFDFDGCFMTPTERQEFKGAVRTTKTLLAIGNDIPDHMQRKDIFFAWLREFVGTHSAEVYGPAVKEYTPAVLMLPPPGSSIIDIRGDIQVVNATGETVNIPRENVTLEGVTPDGENFDGRQAIS